MARLRRELTMSGAGLPAAVQKKLTRYVDSIARAGQANGRRAVAATILRIEREGCPPSLPRGPR